MEINIEYQTDLLSVIVAAYNIADYIERGLDSVCGQTYRNLEIIVVDDGSTDDTGALCDKCAAKDQRIQVIHKKNGGLAEARNVGVAKAKGSYIAFVDGDDWIDSDMYEKMLSALKEQRADVAICRYRQVYKSHTDDQSVDRVIVFEGQEALQYYVQETEEYAIQNAAWNKLYKREIIADLVFPAGKWYEDILHTTTVLSRAARCVYLDTACYNYIIDREGSIMNMRINSRIFTDLIPAYQEKTKFLRSIGRQDLADIHDYFIYKRLLLLYNQFYKESFPERERFLRDITAIIVESAGSDRKHYENVYHCRIANPNEKRKMDLFLQSRWLYRNVMRINEAVILPIKMKIHR